MSERFRASVDRMPQPPGLTADQRAAALEKASFVRKVRADAKERLKAGSLTLVELLSMAESTEMLAKLKVLTVLESLPGLGKVKARRLLESVGIAENRRLQGLGVKQRAELLAQISAP